VFGNHSFNCHVVNATHEAPQASKSRERVHYNPLTVSVATWVPNPPHTQAAKRTAARTAERYTCTELWLARCSDSVFVKVIATLCQTFITFTSVKAVVFL
jgi:hypothetical protein